MIMRITIRIITMITMIIIMTIKMIIMILIMIRIVTIIMITKAYIAHDQCSNALTKNYNQTIREYTWKLTNSH